MGRLAANNRKPEQVCDSPTEPHVSYHMPKPWIRPSQSSPQAAQQAPGFITAL